LAGWIITVRVACSVAMSFVPVCPGPSLFESVIDDHTLMA
jgi:hypothetical protein